MTTKRRQVPCPPSQPPLPSPAPVPASTDATLPVASKPHLRHAPPLSPVTRPRSLRAPPLHTCSSLPFKPRIPFDKIYPNANPSALDLLHRLLLFNPSKRITVEAALAHPYLASLHDPSDEPLAQAPFSFEFENSPMNKSALKALITREMLDFHPEYAHTAAAALALSGGGAAMSSSAGGGSGMHAPIGEAAPGATGSGGTDEAQQQPQPMES